MKFQDLLETVGDEPVFETGLLLAGDRDPADVRRQLSRWVGAGRLVKLRRGLYALASPFRKVKPHPFLVANQLQRGSYVSCQSALAHYGLIPEHVPVTTSVGGGRPQRWHTALGSYDFRHLHRGLVHGYRWLDLGRGQRAFVAAPEKALLDLIYLEPGGDSREYLVELRLQHSELLDLGELGRLTEAAGKPKLRRAAARIAALAEAEGVYEAL